MNAILLAEDTLFGAQHCFTIIIRDVGLWLKCSKTEENAGIAGQSRK